MLISVSTEILNALRSNKTFSQKVLPYLKKDFFDNPSERTVFYLLKTYIENYQNIPKKNSLIIELDSQKVTQSVYDDSKNLIESIYDRDGLSDCDVDFLIDKAEIFCKNQAIHNALIKSIEISDELLKANDTTGFIGSNIPEIFTEALALSFNDNVGHDYFEDAEERFEYYHKTETKIPFGISVLNDITHGGTHKKTMNVIMAGTGVGKTLIMCDFAASNIRDGKNVLYITLEMSEEEISRRIDANLMGVNINDIEYIEKPKFMGAIQKLKEKQLGKLYVKQFPTSIGHVGHFTKLINDLKLKKNFVPDIVYVDYINICASSQGKLAGIVGSYGYMKNVAEEIRGFMVKHDFCGWTATQSNREGNISSDPNITNSSESMGIPNASDLFLAVASNEELAAEGKYMFKQLKNRYNSKVLNPKFFVGINYDKMKLYDVMNETPENRRGTLDAKPDYTTNEDVLDMINTTRKRDITSRNELIYE